jgi:uncharacterized phage-associated protein
MQLCSADIPRIDFLSQPKETPMFNERKVAQMAAYLLAKGETRMAHLKLMKLLYLADRRSMDVYGFPISGDHVVAMPHGPVLSMTLNLIDGDVESCENGWESWISDKENHEVSLKRMPSPELLDELSAADLNALDAVWNDFGHMNRWQIRDYTHNHCPEWKDPNGSSVAIPYEDIFGALGKTPEAASELSARIEAERSLDKLFASL